MTSPPPALGQLTRAMSAVGQLIDGIRDDQWSAPTPCTDWTVRDVIYHLVGINLVFVARLNDQTPPERGTDVLGDGPAGAYRDSGVAAQGAFEQPGVLERTYHSPLGAATGAELLHWRIADLLAHGWDLARATGQPAELPEDLAEQALFFARVQLATMPRTGRFGPAQPVADDASAIDRLVAFLGRPVGVSFATLRAPVSDVPDR
ncbi:MAG: TIGR03086 family metal-binding protein [Pseudonocardiaceae bacterium]